jgi:hypothetical protein
MVRQGLDPSLVEALAVIFGSDIIPPEPGETPNGAAN